MVAQFRQLSSKSASEVKECKITNIDIFLSVLGTLCQLQSVITNQQQIFYVRSEDPNYYAIKSYIIIIASLTTTVFGGRMFFLRKEHDGNFIAIGAVVLGLVFGSNFYNISYFSYDDISSVNTTTNCLQVFAPFCKYLDIIGCNEFIRFIATNIFLCVGQIVSFLYQFILTVNYVKAKNAQNKGNDDEFKKLCGLIIESETDNNLLNIINCYLQGSPRIILFLVYADWQGISATDYSSIWSLTVNLLSFFMLAWSITNFQRKLRALQPGKSEMTRTATFVYLGAHILMIGSRLVILGVGFRFAPLATGFIVTIHWTWSSLYLHNTIKPLEFYNQNVFYHVPFCFVFGVVYVFHPLNLVEKKTVYVKCAFYFISFFENLYVILFASYHNVETDVGARVLLAVLTMGSYLVGIGLLIIYYQSLHPTGKRNRISQLESSSIIMMKELNHVYPENSSAV